MSKRRRRDRRGRPRAQVILVNRNVMIAPDLDAWMREKAAARACSISSYARWVLLKERQQEQEADAQKEPEPELATA